MALFEFLNKGIDYVQSKVGNIEKSIDNKLETKKAFDDLVALSIQIEDCSPIIVNNHDIQEGKIQSIMKLCLSLNVEKARVIDSFLAIDETPIYVALAKEVKASRDWMIVLADKGIYLLDEKEYKKFQYGEVKAEIVYKSILSQGVKFADRAFYIEGNLENSTKLIELLEDEEKRSALIAEKTTYLCGIKPKLQLLNKLKRGITIEDDKIVLHTGKENILMNLNDICKMQLLVDDAVVLSKSKNEEGNMVSNSMEARKMAVKVSDREREYVIEVMPVSSMGKSYKREDSIYIENYEFARKIIETIEKLKGGI